ncbi:MAG TPA: 23S rRNA (uracil(1939)-C(5))-methyltransferase RlmD [Casimicrobiaceae bacterium]|nr:23S rRNA (uracil(1939)-C(5))-methyltransferase RlmD [Casimicrobiaceae bacterium]
MTPKATTRDDARTVSIESLDQEGRGVAHVDGKATFVEGALPGERVAIEILKRKPSYSIARATRVERASASRVAPACPHFGQCGGCTLQHADPALQLAAKQRALEDSLARIGDVRPDVLLPAIAGPAWGYRYRARLSVRDVAKKGGILVGFHERRSSYVADMRECAVLPPKISALLPLLRRLVESLSIRSRLPQIEVAVGERLSKSGSDAIVAGTAKMCPGSEPRLVYALVLRILEPLTRADEARLVAFADTHGVEIWLQPGGPDTVVALHPANATLAYTLPEFDVALPFAPTDFTQVNFAINRVLVRRAVDLLAPAPDDRVADFFCGLGNFTLPIARRAGSVVGFEGSKALVARAAANARRNGLDSKASFVSANLFTVTSEIVSAHGRFARVLIDPPREGAVELAKALPSADDAHALARIVYVSCNPGTLARDAAVLVHDRGYRLASAGVVNMFPHTAHVESIAVFDRPQ